MREMSGALHLKVALEKDGFKCDVNQLQSEGNECNWYGYRRTKLKSRECECNDGKPVQIVVKPFIYTVRGQQHESCSVEVCGQANEVWFKLDAYSLSIDEILSSLPKIEEMLIGAWSGLTARVDAT